MYVGLWSRLKEFRRDSLTRALERRSVVQGTSLRITIHLVSPAQWWRWGAAIRSARREQWLRYHRNEPSAREMAAAARRIGPLLERRPLSRKELAETVGKGAAGVNGVGLWRDLVRVPPSGTWERRRADLFGDAALWLGEAPAIDEGDAIAELARDYMRGFGPGSPKQIASWAGLGAKRIARALEGLELRQFRSEDGETLYDLPRAPLPPAEALAPVRFLPVWDATLLVHARGAEILPENYRPRIFNTKTPHSVNTFLVDGAVAGTWRFERGRIETDPFEKLDRATAREVDHEAERLAAFYAD